MPETVYSIYGTQGDDQLTGTASADSIYGDAGDDLIESGAGDDIIVDISGSNVIRSGTGNDYVLLREDYTFDATVYEGIHRTNFVQAGDGNDVVQVDRGMQGLTVDLGSGNDLFLINQFGDNMLLTTGDGVDRIVLSPRIGSQLPIGQTLVIVDFTAGDGGDVLDVSRVLGAMPWIGDLSNPFASGHISLIQDGDDVLVRIDADGFGPLLGGYAECNIVRLQNVSITSLTDYNLGGYDIAGAASSPTTVNGTEVGEGLAAEGPGSTVNGFGGNDRIYGGYGDDNLYGGNGDDIVDGGLGDDHIYGGAGNDTLTDRSGSGVIDGGDGNDVIDIQRSFNSTSQVDGIGALDFLNIYGGAGNDLLRYSANHGASLLADLGAGNDRFEIVHYVNQLSLTLGAGEDRVVFDQSYLVALNEPTDLHAIVITDFTAGAGGDVLELDRLLISGTGWDGISNPFASGHLLLVQSGDDTLVIFNYGGNQNHNYQYQLVRLVGVEASSLTEQNFSGYNPVGTVSSYTMTNGTDGDDQLYDSTDSDMINGGLGDDIIVLNKSGADTVDGGPGNDAIIVSSGYGPTGLVSLIGGAGNDLIDVLVSTGDGYRVLVDAGTGNDRVLLRNLSGPQNTIALGAGTDTLVLSASLNLVVTNPAHVTDFETGENGDRLDWAVFMAALTKGGAPQYNPFYYGTARLIQNGSNVELQVNWSDNHSTSPLFETIIVFENTNVADFTTFNLGFDPNHPTLLGTTVDDVLGGTAFRDIIHGLAGNDQIAGLDGNDSLWGEEGDDALDGGVGNDLLRGGAGVDSLFGGAGNDDLEGGFGPDTVDGGDGDDLITDWDGSDTIVGGTGNDRIDVRLGYDNRFGTTNAGDGDDIVTIDNVYTRGSYAVDLGAGNDTLIIDAPSGQVRLGTGSDTIIWNTSYDRNGQLVIADFQAGNGGDLFDLRAFLSGAGMSAYDDRSFTGNPFTAGYVELRQNGANVELYFHRNGYDETIEYGLNPDVIFRGRTVAQFTAANFGGFDPHAAPNWTNAIRTDYTVAAGEVVTSHNVTGVYGYSPAFFFPWSGDVTLTNHGTINVIVDGWPAGYACGFSSYISPPSGFVVNADDGAIYVRDDRSMAYGSRVNIRNAGWLEVSAPDEAYGVYFAALENSGTLRVTSEGFAFGVFSGGYSSQPFVNTGTIEVLGGELAFGIYWQATSQSFNNAGTINVSTDPSSPYASIGAYLWDDGSSPLDHYNSGTIIADIAIYADRGVRNHPTYDNAIERVHNSGTIIGDIMLAGGDDIVYNTGLISGQVLLEAGNDKFVGSGGIVDGLVDGGAGNDNLSGSRERDFFLGGDGDDTLNASSGNDFLVGGAGNDMLDGGSGIDTASYFDSSNGVKVDLNLTEPQDTLSAGLDTLIGVEWLEGSLYKDILSGNAGSNALFGLAGADQLFGRDGNDFLDGGLGDDLLDGGSGVDTASYVSAASGVTVNLAVASSQTTGMGDDTLRSIEDLEGSLFSDVLTGDDAANTLSGLDGNDRLKGLGGDDVLRGDLGNDTLDGGIGLDRMYGGLGDDTYIVSDASDYTYEYAGEGTDLVLASVTTRLRDFIENLTLTGSGKINGTGNALDNTIRGNEAGNALSGMDGADLLYGNGGNDVLDGGVGDDKLFGGDGDDTLTGGAGLDRLYGGLGDDSYIVTDDQDFAYENAGEGYDQVFSSIDLQLRDNVEMLTLTGTAAIGKGNALDNLIVGTDGGNRLYGYDGDDRLEGNGGDDYLVGGAGNDVLVAGSGYDRLFGGTGDDVYYATDRTTYVYENAGEGNDRVVSSVTMVLRPNVEELVLTGTDALRGYGNELSNQVIGNDGANQLYGYGGTDHLAGGGGNDVLDGGEGGDLIEGGAGTDRFYGGAGADTFLFRDGDFGGLSSSTADRIHDFSQAEGDRIRLDLVDANVNLAGDQAFSFIGSSAFHGIAGELRAVQQSGVTYVMGDTNGDGQADFWVRLDGLHTLGNNDFVL